jgi:L-iditol 2-dehydrogenase
MKAARWHGPQKLEIELVPVPQVLPGSALIKVEACAVCGSDIRIFREGNPRISPPRIIGHEVSGQVVAVGQGVTRIKPGDRIAVGADVPCGECDHCLNGRGNCCDTNFAIGYQFDGGYAQYLRLDPVVVEHGPISLIRTDISFDAAALAEPLACCINGYEVALARPGCSVAVFGAGPIGLMLGLLGQGRYQASQVLIVEPSEARRAQAESLGLRTIDPGAVDPVTAIIDATAGRGADVLFTACPAVETHEQAIAAVAKRGVVNLFGGLAKSARPITFLSNHLHYREAYVTGSHGSTPAHHREALELIESGSIDAARLVTRTIKLDDLAEGLEIARSGTEIKVIVRPNA